MSPGPILVCTKLSTISSVFWTLFSLWIVHNSLKLPVPIHIKLPMDDITMKYNINQDQARQIEVL